MSVTRVRFHKAGDRYVSDDYKALFYKDKAQGGWWHLQHRVDGGFVTLGITVPMPVGDAKRWAERLVIAQREEWEKETDEWLFSHVECEFCNADIDIDTAVRSNYTSDDNGRFGQQSMYFCPECASDEEES